MHSPLGDSVVVVLYLQIEHDTFTQCWFNVGPALETSDQHETLFFQFEIIINGLVSSFRFI